MPNLSDDEVNEFASRRARAIREETFRLVTTPRGWRFDYDDPTLESEYVKPYAGPPTKTIIIVMNRNGEIIGREEI